LQRRRLERADRRERVRSAPRRADDALDRAGQRALGRGQAVERAQVVSYATIASSRALFGGDRSSPEPSPRARMRGPPAPPAARATRRAPRAAALRVHRAQAQT
jgi:hypothetical protein